ncbi:SDR family oxidoreductase [Streptococcus sp. DD12]|uniref:SDR family oxidoreductase n=1 Tax=Streptococcus sp. DD12 TaxID=1777880 RepID=UPI00079B430B|nr:SDR family oxidoreductase [Streptococcus sp. DD12]KXT75521.1 Short-chain dehydrogenase/oxidoreductase [Streptococcus sp. DD12]
MFKKVIVLVGSGAIGMAIARRVAIGKELVLADLRLETAQREADALSLVGYSTHAVACDVSDPQSVQSLVEFASDLGEVVGLINTAGMSASQASVEQIFKVDLYGNALLFEVFAPIMAEGGSVIVIGSQSSHRLEDLGNELIRSLATLPSDQLLNLPIIQETSDGLRAYQIAKRGNALRCAADSAKWADKHLRFNCISAGIVYTPLANDELNGIHKDFYRKMLADSPAGRGGTPDDIANLAEFLMSDKASYVAGADFLIDGGATANYFWGSQK